MVQMSLLFFSVSRCQLHKHCQTRLSLCASGHGAGAMCMWVYMKVDICRFLGRYIQVCVCVQVGLFLIGYKVTLAVLSKLLPKAFLFIGSQLEGPVWSSL